MITVAEAAHIIGDNTGQYGTEAIAAEWAAGRILAEDILADRDLPPYDRVTMDGIAISYAAFDAGIRSYRIKATIAAGDTPTNTGADDECVEIMTGAALPPTTDTVVRYEDLNIRNGIATIVIDTLKKGQNIHRRAKDKKQGAMVVPASSYIDAAVISMAASVGKTMLTVKKLPTVAIITTGDELVDIDRQPGPYQVRKSNSYAISAVLRPYGITADILHIGDDLAATKDRLHGCLNAYDVIILSGGVSMGKADYVPQALEELGVALLFHKVKQRPGKPFWFGRHDACNTIVFAFPGNPVSAFLCTYRYFLPWLQASLGMTDGEQPYAALDEDVTFAPDLQYFVQVRVKPSPDGRLLATPVEGHGSGDFANLLTANAFMELPAEQTNFNKGEPYRIWPFKHIIA